MARGCVPKRKAVPKMKHADVSIRVHGSGDFVVASEYDVRGGIPKKYIASGAYLRQAINNSVPVWIDAERMSPVQFASVIRAVEGMKGKDKDLVVEVVERDGRKMVLATRNKRYSSMNKKSQVG